MYDQSVRYFLVLCSHWATPTPTLNQCLCSYYYGVCSSTYVPNLNRSQCGETITLINSLYIEFELDLEPFWQQEPSSLWCSKFINKQESPAWPQETYYPPRSKYSLCCSVSRGGGVTPLLSQLGGVPRFYPGHGSTPNPTGQDWDTPPPQERTWDQRPRKEPGVSSPSPGRGQTDWPQYAGGNKCHGLYCI